MPEANGTFHPDFYHDKQNKSVFFFTRHWLLLAKIQNIQQNLNGNQQSTSHALVKKHRTPHCRHAYNVLELYYKLSSSPYAVIVFFNVFMWASYKSSYSQNSFYDLMTYDKLTCNT